MINDRHELNLFIKSDLMMNRGFFSWPIKQRLLHIIYPDYVMRYLWRLRKAEYYSNCCSQYSFKRLFNEACLSRLGIKLGFSIAYNVFGYGLVIPHYGTIVVGVGNKIGNYCVLHTSTCISAGEKKIGDAFYVSTGAKILKDIHLGDNVSVAANSVLNQSSNDSDCMFAGMPAQRVKDSEPWYKRDSKEYCRRVAECSKLWGV